MKTKTNYEILLPLKGIKKILLVMKLIIFLLCMTILQVTASTVFPQGKNVTIDMQDVTVRDVIHEIEEQGEIRFFYSDDLDELNKHVSISLMDTPVKTALENTLAQADMTYQVIKDNFVVLIPLKGIARQAEGTITGKVTDSDGNPLPGVNVTVKGTLVGTITDQDGYYELEVPSDALTLVFSFTGMLSMEMAIGDNTQIDVTLAPDVIGLEEVVVIGYGTVKKSDVTGSVSSLESDDLSKGVIIAPQQALQGKVSGVNVITDNGEPGANSTVLIRGGTSITASNAPLYVIDGVPVDFSEGSYRTTSSRQTRSAFNPLNMLNASDIKSIDVLKDASATAIYGSRGANGVIMITTKEGLQGEPGISYDAYFGLSKIRRELDVLSADEFRSYMNDHPEITGWTDGGANTDWQDQIYRTASTQSHNLSFSQVNQKTNYRASVTYSDQQGIIINSDLQRVIARINLHHRALNDRVNVKLFLSGASLKSNRGANPESTGSQYDGGIIRDALGYDPTLPVKDANGDYTYRGPLNLNPVEQANTLTDVAETKRALGNMMIDLKLTDFLNFNTNLGFTQEFINRYFYAPINSQVGSDSHGMASQQGQNNFSDLLESNFLFNKSIGDDHDLNAILGYSFQEFFYTGSYIYSSDFITDANTYNNLGAGLTQNPVQTNKSSNRLISFFGRATYSFRNKYLLTATVRRDGSSRFGENHKWGTFPSMAFAWKLSEEDFLINNHVISNLKLRLGYGVTGNQSIGNYNSLATLSPGEYIYIIGGEPYVAVGPDQNFNPDLKWESTAQFNAGLDFGILDNRISGSLDLYRKTTKDLLLSFDVPSPSEVSSILANVGGIQNQGVEFEFNGIVVSKSNFSADIYGNLSYNAQEVTSLSNETWNTEAIYFGGVRAAGFSGFTSQIIVPGQPLGTFYGYEYTGVDESGLQTFEDMNNDGEITPGEDRTYIGSYHPDFLFGMGTQINYKGFSLDCFLRGTSGAEILNSTALAIQNKTRIPAFNASDASLNDGLAYGESNIFSSKWVQDASFLRLEYLNLGYNFNLASSRVFSSLYLYLTGQNLFVLTKYSGYDPEVNGGIDYMAYPKPRNFLLGISVEF
jgi:TonB-linked SusC/RagA family outer membrane protein